MQAAEALCTVEALASLGRNVPVGVWMMLGVGMGDISRRISVFAKALYQAPSTTHPHDLALMISTKAGFKLAPPTRNPSISPCFASSLQFFSETLPP